MLVRNNNIGCMVGVFLSIAIGSSSTAEETVLVSISRGNLQRKFLLCKHLSFMGKCFCFFDRGSVMERPWSARDSPIRALAALLNRSRM